MMEDHEFCDSCPGCRPAIGAIDEGTGRVTALPDDHPMMKIVNEYWDNKTSYSQRRAYIEVTLKNSRKPHDLKLCYQVNEGMQQALNQLEGQ